MTFLFCEAYPEPVLYYPCPLMHFPFSKLLPDGICHDTDFSTTYAGFGVVTHAEIVSHLMCHGSSNCNFIPAVILWKQEPPIISTSILEQIGTSEKLCGEEKHIFFQVKTSLSCVM